MQTKMILKKTSCTPSLLQRSKNSLHSFLHYFFHTKTYEEDLSHYYTHLLQTNPHTNSITQTHTQILINGLSNNSFLATHLVKSYAKVQNYTSSRLVFENVYKKRVFIWNAMIRAYSVTSSWVEIIELFKRMELERIQPDHYTLPFVIKAFGVLLKVDEGKRVHEVARKLGLVRNVYVGTALMEMYIKFGDLEMGFQLFDEMPKRDIVSWTSMISGYVEHGFYKEGLRVFNEMRLGDDDNKPNWVTVLSVIPACDYSIHSFVVKCGFDSIAEVQTAVLNMYVKGGDVVEGYRLFCEMKEKSLVSWTVMVSGYSQNGYASEALTLFYQMLKMTDLKLDAIIAASVLQACAQLGSLNYGEMIHGYVVRMGPVVGLEAETSLVDMYAKCGSLNAAQRVFGEMRNRNMITWSALISGYGCHGFGSKALDLFEQMKREGFIPDEAAFLSVLSACSHSGLVSEGKEFFNLMRQTYGMSPGLKHYACVIDLLGRAGLIGEAWDMIEGMPFEPDTNIWRSLLSACKIKGNVNVAEYACNQLMELDYDNTDYHVLLANIYASCGKWNEVSKVRSVIRGKGEKKSPGCSYIEVNCKIRNFFAGDKSHPESENLSFIVEMLHTLVSNNQ